MGNTKPSKKNQQPDTEQIEHYYDEIVQYDECCGMQRKKLVKKGLIWQENFQRNCQDLFMYYEWIHDIQETVRANAQKLPRKKFLDEVNALRVINQNQPPPKQNQILLSPSQIDEFKRNLKNSVLLSYAQKLKSSRPKQSRIQSLMFSTSSKPKNLNMTSSFNSPPSIKRRSEGLHDESRKDTILKERERTLRQSYSKSGFRESIMSFVDDTMSNLFRGHEKDISKQSAHCLGVFLKFSLILEKHLNNRENIICMVIQNFMNYIYKKYPIFESSDSKKEGENSEIKQKQKEVIGMEDLDQKIKAKIKKQRFKLLQKRRSLTAEEIDQFTTDIKIFLVLVRQIIQDYYKTNQFSYQFVIQSQQQQSTTSPNQRELENYNINTLITNDDNILILATAILFKNQKFYNHVMVLFKKFHYERDMNFKMIIEGLKDRPPEYFQIKAQYCLNELTLEKFLISASKKQPILDQINTEDEKKKSKIEQSHSYSPSHSLDQARKLSVSQESKQRSYWKCAQSLQKILKSRTPSSKMKVIMQCSQKITQSVSQFYNTNNIQLKNHVLDADQILSIFCYLLATNEIENIHANLFMIQHFATENQMISVTGYYYSVLTIAVEQLENMYSSTVADIDNTVGSIEHRKESSVKSKHTSKGKTKAKEKLKKSFSKVD